MRVQEQRVTCQKCAHVFEAQLVMDAPIAVVAASMEAVYCANCGSKKCGLGGSYSDAPPLTAPVHERAMWWRNRGDIGTSSLTIWCVFTGGTSPHGRFDYPLDADDFQRCHWLLELIPEWRADLGKVSERLPWMKPFVDRWGRFEKLYQQEISSGKARRLYALMKIAEKEAEAIRDREDEDDE